MLVATGRKQLCNVKCQSPNVKSMSNTEKKYDLEERTALFGEAIIDFAKTLPVLGQIFCDLRRNSFDIHLEGSNNDS